MPRSSSTALAAVALLLLLGACGTVRGTPAPRAEAKPSSSSAPPRSISKPTVAQSTTTTSSAVSSEPTGSSSPTCLPSDLRLAYAFSAQTLMQQSAAFFSFTNTGVRSCWLQGYPGVEALTASGSVINMPFVRRVPYPIPMAPCPCRFTVAPGHLLYFAIGWSPVSQPFGNTAGCETSGTLLVYPPNTTRQLTVSFSALLCPNSEAVTPVGPISGFYHASHSLK